MGRKKTPTAVKRLAGNPGNRPLNDSEPSPPSGVPRVPAWLPPSQRKHWKTLAPMLDDMGVLTKADGMLLAMLCGPLTRYIEALEIIEAEKGAAKYLTTTDKGAVYQNPMLGVMNVAWVQVVKLSSEFGLTPSSRSSLHVSLTDVPQPVGKEKFFAPKLKVVG